MIKGFPILKPCPFCGRNVEPSRVDACEGGLTRLEIDCCIEFILTTETLMYHKRPFSDLDDKGYIPERNLIDLWNTRAEMESGK